MAKPKTKLQIVEHLSNKTDLPKKIVNQFLDELMALSYKEAKMVLSCLDWGSS